MRTTGNPPGRLVASHVSATGAKADAVRLAD
jgi:hypothetical protein